MARKSDTIKVIIQPATDNAHKEKYVKVNGKVIPFGIPMELKQDDIACIKRIKEPKRNSSNRSVYDVMEQLKITQEQANRIMRSGDSDITQNVNIGFVPKYNISKA